MAADLTGLLQSPSSSHANIPDAPSISSTHSNDILIVKPSSIIYSNGTLDLSQRYENLEIPLNK